MAVTIFVEGKADKRFIEDFIIHHFSQDIFKKIKFVDVKGKDSVHLVSNEFIKNSDQEGTNLLIFDADSDYAERVEELEKQKQELGIDFELFLFPNDKDVGDLESLLLNLTVSAHKGIFECFKPFNDCLLGKNSNYNVPSLKTQIYSYLDFQRLEPKENERNYIIDCWDLNNEYAKPLFDFLNRYL
jgi:hypothetical protein